MSRSIGYLIVVGVVTTTPLAGQDVALMAHRLDSTNRALIAVRDSLVAYRTAHRSSYGNYTDSIVIAAGKVKVLFNDDFAAVARAGAAEAEKQLGEFGSALNRIKPFVFSIVPDTALTPYDEQLGRKQSVNVRQHLASDPANPTRTSTDGDARSVGFVISSTVSVAMTAASASRVSAWMNGAFGLAPGLTPKSDWDVVRLALVSSPSFLGKSCYLGDVRACRLFLSLDTVPDPPRMLLDSVGRRLVVKYEQDHVSRASRVATQRCLDGNDDACIAVLDIAGMSPLASPYLRGTMIVHAIDLGGDHAVERLLTTPGSARDALAGAAKQPIDSVVASWQGHLNDRSAGRALPLVVAISSLAWIAVCVFLALRSSRWR